MRTSRVIVLLGPPASGKGTQAQRLARHLDGLHISTGFLLRQAVQMQTSLGTRVKSFVDAGELVPDAMVLDLVRETVSGIRGPCTAILDGFPRTIGQARVLETFLPPDRAILIDLRDEEVILRISGRRMGPEGEPYHIAYNPPPAGLAATQRSDDREEVVRERLTVYRKQTGPLLDYYQSRELLQRVSGSGSIDDVFHRLVSLIV